MDITNEAAQFPKTTIVMHIIVGLHSFDKLCLGGTMSLDGTIEGTSAARRAGEKLESTPTITYRFLNLLQ
jgi:hypothetical protein